MCVISLQFYTENISKILSLFLPVEPRQSAGYKNSMIR